MKAINLAEKLSTFSEPFQPRVVGQFNGHDLMVTKLKGEFVWHQHDETDDFFLVLNGRLTIRMRQEMSLSALRRPRALRLAVANPGSRRRPLERRPLATHTHSSATSRRLTAR